MNCCNRVNGGGGGSTSCPPGVEAFGVSTIGNTAGQTGTHTGTVVLVGLGAVTLSQATVPGSETISISVPAQTIQPGVDALGVSTLGNTAGQTGTHTGTVVLVGLGAVTLSQATAAGIETISISGALSLVQPNFYKNIASQAQSFATIANGILASNTMSLTYMPIDPRYAFPFDMTPQMMVLDLNETCTMSFVGVSRNSNVTNPVTVTQSSTLGQTWMVGIYTISGSSTLQLFNSVSLAFSESTSASGSIPGTTSSVDSSAFSTAAVNFTQSIGGPRWLVLNSSAWSSALRFSRGVEYFIALSAQVSTSRSNSNNDTTASVTVGGPFWAQNFSVTGQVLGSSVSGTRRGTMGVASASASSLGALQFAGIFSTTTSALPTTLGINELNKTQGGLAYLLPHVMLNNYGTGVL